MGYAGDVLWRKSEVAMRAPSRSAKLPPGLLLHLPPPRMASPLQIPDQLRDVILSKLSDIEKRHEVRAEAHKCLQSLELFRSFFLTLFARL